MDAIEALKAQIKGKRAAFVRLKEKEVELKELQSEVALLPGIQADLVALERSLAILQGDDAVDAHENMNRVLSAKLAFHATASDLAVSVLREAGKPLTLEQIMPLLRVRGASFAEATVRGALYRNVRRDRYFKLVGKGLFALREWKIDSIEDYQDLI